MSKNTLKVLVCMMAAALLLPLSEGTIYAELLNPDGINPHAEAPRKRISVERKIAAAEARKKKQAEIAAKKTEQQAAPDSTNQGATTAGPASNITDKNK